MKSRYLLLSFLVTCLFYSCTDVPLSYNTQILNRQILGYWQPNDSTAFSFTEKDAKAIFQSYEYDPGKDQYVPEEDPSSVYFCDIMIAGRNHQFISIGEKKDSSFSTLEYSFNAGGYLELKGIATDLTYAGKTSTTLEKIYFETSLNFLQYVKEKISSPDFHGNSILSKPRYNFLPLQKPAVKTNR